MLHPTVVEQWRKVLAEARSRVSGEDSPETRESPVSFLAQAQRGTSESVLRPPVWSVDATIHAGVDESVDSDAR